MCLNVKLSTCDVEKGSYSITGMGAIVKRVRSQGRADHQVVVRKQMKRSKAERRAGGGSGWKQEKQQQDGEGSRERSKAAKESEDRGAERIQGSTGKALNC